MAALGPTGCRLATEAAVVKQVLAWIGAVVVALILGFAAGMWFHEQVQIDRCFDHGGVWRYDLFKCEGDNPQR